MHCKLRNKNLSLALTLIFLCSLFLGALPVQPAYAQFLDIKGNWAEDQIKGWVDKGLAGGYSDGTFRPNNQVTRAEFVALTNRAFGKQNKTARADFKDVKETHWFYAEVAVAQADGYCTGFNDGTFKPSNPITRQEVASIISRLLDLEAGTAGKAFADAEVIAPWARDAVNAVVTAGIMSGYTDGTFQGGNPITRAEAVVTLDRALGITNIPAAAPEGITGSITLDGKAVENAIVFLFVEKGTEPIEETTSDRDGKFTFNVDPGIYDITAAKDKYVAYAAGVSLSKDGTVQDLSLAEGAFIKGRLADKQGKAVKNAKLFFTTNPTFETITGNNGNFSLYVPAGKKYTMRGYKNNNPGSGMEILAENVEAGTAGSQSLGSIRAPYSLTTPGGGGSGGGNGTGTVATPTASPAPGAVPAGTEVTLDTNTEEATIRYTTNGSEPIVSSTEYLAPITITEAVTIKAKAFKNGWNASGAATFSYTVVSETVPVTAITVTGEGEATTVLEGKSLQMTATVEPTNATDPSVSWSVEAGTGTAIIDANGLLTGTGAGTVTVKATANDGSEVEGTTLITVVKPSPFAGGDGSAENPYQVATAEQLDSVREYLDKHFVQVADIDLGVAPWNDGEGWVPIGTSDGVFSGFFDGNGFKITNLTMNYSSGEGYGLFGAAGFDASYENYAVFKNIALEDVNISANLRVGSLLGMGRAHAIVIDNCYATGTITANTADAGGLVGSSQGIIKNSYANITINGSARTSGGLAGQSSGSVNNCYALGNVNGTEDIGGLIGFNGGNIANSYSTGNVTGTDFVGGLSGIGHGSIEQCFSSGNVIGARYVGGLIGGGNANITDSYATGNVNGSSSVGGLIGLLENGSVSKGFATGEVTGGGGGLIGSTSNAVCSNSYYDTETTGKWDTGKGVPKATVEMIEQNTFSGWDFNTVWTIDTDPASYPYFLWQTGSIPYPPSVFAGGSGTEADPYEVASAEQLNKIRDYPNKHFIQTANIDLADYLGINGPEYNDGEGWRPVGDRYTAFNGTFDGNGYIISNLIINRPDNDYQGLFGYTGNNAKLTGMALESLDVTGDMYVGGLAGQNNGHIKDCYTAGVVRGTYTQVGGLVGYNFAYSGADGSIINSHSTVVVTGHEEVGGLVGYNSGGLISESYASGDVTGVYYDDDESEQIGGLVGDSGGRIENSHASGNVSGYEDIGGLAGSSNGEINSCYTTGTVSGTMEVGGLVGDCSGSINDSHAAGIVSGSSRVGGLVGNSYANITCSYATGPISGYEYLGGLIGYSGNGEIQKSFATGNVSMLGGVEAAAGGLAGSIQNTLVDDCYATGDVTGHKEVGGLVGYVSVGAEIDHCYAVGSVDKLNSTSYSLGGLIGATTSPIPTVTGSYYDQEKTGQIDNGLGTPKTTKKMKQITTYVDWDFDAIWGINPSENDGYPFLRWQGYDHQPAATAALIGHWKFDESVGEAVYDSSGNDYKGTIIGATRTSDRNGESGKALEFGQNKWVNIPDTLKPEEITVCAWVYVTGTDSSAAPIFSAEKGSGSAGFSYRLQITPDAKLRMEAIAPHSTSGARVATSGELLNMNQWYHVAGTYDGYDTKIYIDGVLVESVSEDSYKTLKTDPAIPVAIGHLENWSVQWFRGKIDDARIYAGALSEDEIRSLLR